ncbi:hypothetical protein DFJ74DRAFT_608140 [Hyaloraphidium curvatum]|nr:hypothetical protein DFJ74DRAFT_608140 [Hyaloraphidium curvatum]
MELTPEARALVTGDDDDESNELPDTSAHSQFKGLDAGDIVAQLQNHPFFMNDLPGGLEENDMLEAMRELVYEGPPEEVAANFKNQGNEAFKRGKAGYRDALEFYTSGLAVKAGDPLLDAVLHANRAAVNLELKNYRAVLNDCAEAIKLDPSNVKAYYRAARACLALGRLKEALDAAERGLAIDAENAPLRAEKDKIEAKLREEKRKEDEKKARQRQEKMAELRLAQALRMRGLRMRGAPKVEDARVKLDPETNRLFWPVFFLYPEHKESDFVKAFDEADTLDDQLETMFEELAPWDSAGEYRADSVDVFVEDADSDGKRLFRVPSAKTLGEILQSRGFVVKNGIPSFFVVPRTGASRERFLGRYEQVVDLPG